MKGVKNKMFKFLTGLLTGGMGTVFLALGGYLLYGAFTAAAGWMSVFYFILGVVGLILGGAMMRTIGEIVMFWSQVKRSVESAEEKENDRHGT
jgi:hypothetical protein